MEEVGEGDHVGQENDSGLKHRDRLDFTLKPRKVFRRKRGRRPPRKMQANQDMKDEEQAEVGNAGNNSEPNQSLPQLPRTSLEVLPRKRGRPRITHSEGVKEELGGEGGHSGRKNQTCLSQRQPEHSMKLLQGISFPEVAFASESRCLTRSMKAYLDRCSARSAPLISPVRNLMTTATGKHEHRTIIGDISAAKSSSYHAKNQGLSFSPNSLTCHNLHASALPSETDNLSTSVFTKLGDLSIATDHDLLEINTPAADLLAQNNRSGDLRQADPSDLEFIIDNYQPAEEAHMPSNITVNTNKETASKSKQRGACPSRSVSLNLTQMCSLMDDDIADFDEVGSRLDDALVSVNGYQVKAEVAPILRDIFFRYGDIAKDTTFCAVKTRSCLLENVCEIYKKLEGANFMLITPTELNSLLEEVRDLETVKIELGWLHYRLDEILEAKMGLNSLKEEKLRITQAIKARRQILECHNKELEGHKRALEALTKRIQEEENALAVEETQEEMLNAKFVNMKSTLKGFCRKSLVHGLL